MRRLPYGLGIAIPCALMALAGWGMLGHVLVHSSPRRRAVWTAGFALAWLSYGLAIFTDPGRVDPKRAEDLQFVKWCVRCSAPKPERAHHCSQCRRCVLKMDHHCPWTANCVGHGNLPQFVRFVGTVTAMTGWSAWEAGSFCWQLWSNPHLPAYLYSNTSLVVAIVFTPLYGLVSFTLALLLLRVLNNLLQGKTQIEDWEMDRVAALARRRMAPRVEFPFDIDPWSNAVAALGPVWAWPLPWGSSADDGHHFETLFARTSAWPPDPESVRAHDFYRVDRWISPEGENLADFGVDPETERATSEATDADAASDATLYDAADDSTPLAEVRRRRVAV